MYEGGSVGHHREQLRGLAKILEQADPVVFHHLRQIGAGECFFAYRMVIVQLRRELPLAQVLPSCCLSWDLRLLAACVRELEQRRHIGRESSRWCRRGRDKIAHALQAVKLWEILWADEYLQRIGSWTAPSMSTHPSGTVSSLWPPQFAPTHAALCVQSLWACSCPHVPDLCRVSFDTQEFAVDVTDAARCAAPVWVIRQKPGGGGRPGGAAGSLAAGPAAVLHRGFGAAAEATAHRRVPRSGAR